MNRFLSTRERRAATRLTSTWSQPPNAALPTCCQNGHSPNGSPQPHRSSSVMPLAHRWTSSPTGQTPGSCPSQPLDQRAAAAAEAAEVQHAHSSTFHLLPPA